jgi:hypothetical protein
MLSRLLIACGVMRSALLCVKFVLLIEFHFIGRGTSQFAVRIKTRDWLVTIYGAVFWKARLALEHR